MTSTSEPVPIDHGPTPPHPIPSSRPSSWSKQHAQDQLTGPSSGGWTPGGTSPMGGISGTSLAGGGHFSFGQGVGSMGNAQWAPSGSWRGEGWQGLPVPPSSPSNPNPLMSTSMTFSSTLSPFGHGSYLPSSPAYSSRDLSMSVDSDSGSLPHKSPHLGAMFAHHGQGFSGSGQHTQGLAGSFGGHSFTGPGSVERQSKLEQNFTSNFTCCGLQLKGLHDLLEHYEESHILVPKPNAFPKQPVQRSAISASQPAVSHLSLSTPPQQQQPPPHLMGAGTPSPTTDSDAPHTPGMMDLEMDDAPLASPFPIASFPRPSSSAPSPWSSSSALVPQTISQTPQCVPPSLLTYSLPPRTASPALTTATTPTQAVGMSSPAGTQTKASKKDSATPGGSPVAGEKPPKKKREKKEKVEGEEGEEGAASEKRFRCPVDGCGKVYKQQNGLKYHLQRSINSSHGHLAGTVTPAGVLVPPPPVTISPTA